SFDIACGISAVINPIKRSANGVLVNIGDNNTGNFVTTYGEEITSFKDISLGLDLIINYSFYIKRVRFFAGLHGRYIPTPIKGRYESFENYSFSNSGSFEIQRSYLGLNLGIYLFTK